MSCLSVASAAMLVQAVRGCPVRNGLLDTFPPAMVNSQMAQVDRAKILEQMVFGSSPVLARDFVTIFFQIEDFEKSKSFRCENKEEKPDTCIINRLWNICGQIGVEHF